MSSIYFNNGSIFDKNGDFHMATGQAEVEVNVKNILKISYGEYIYNKILGIRKELLIGKAYTNNWMMEGIIREAVEKWDYSITNFKSSINAKREVQIEFEVSNAKDNVKMKEVLNVNL